MAQEFINCNLCSLPAQASFHYCSIIQFIAALTTAMAQITVTACSALSGAKKLRYERCQNFISLENWGFT